jgi:transcription-repair coupling factor (superfamily II helicase)
VPLVADNEAPALEIRTAPTAGLRSEILRETTRTDVDLSAHSLLLPLVEKIRSARQQGRTVLLPTHTLGGVERLRELLKAHHLEVRHLKDAPDLLAPTSLKDGLRDPSVHAYTWIAKPVDPARGADLPQLEVLLVAEEEIFGKRARRSSEKVRKGGFKTTLGDLSEGDYVVHVEHGVGHFQGLVRLNVRGLEQDYLHLVYDGNAKLYLPVHRINLVQKYAGPGGKPPRLDKLGGTGWETTKKKVKQAVLAMAQDLLALYAKRELTQRPHHTAPDEAYWAFEAAFQFETTPDQQKAIDDVVTDMQKPRPMDRLICGDVGYGKTEVGMRGAMLALTSGRQVAVLAPTTVLAQQHFQTFSERFKGTPAIVEVISRFKKTGEVNEILGRTKEGKVDVLIGTHRLLSPDVAFKNLGLVLVDEEQRFGVKSKEALKKLRTNVDILTLTATPIPRTLQMGFFGVRDMSVIETPPVDRRAIRTSIVKKDEELVREAVLRELGRGGQVYFVHNRVRSIQATADWIKRIVPEARVGIGHGQMGEDELEDVMLRFMKHEVNVLVCTAIIETGIDVPTANTMFVDHAEDFGLAQLYQIRGRVGRSKERAFAYLLIEGSTEHLHPEARKRLEILQRFSDLGAGFQVAQHDLELRGAGDLLGASQHGHVTAVGYDLYTALLRDAVEELKGRAHDDAPDPDINLPIAALIPDKYIPDIHERLQIYQRLAVAKDTAEIYDIIGGLSEMYGEAPAEVSALGDVMSLKMKTKELYARSLEVVLPEQDKAPKIPGKPAPPPVPKVVLTLGDRAKLDSQRLAAWVQKEPERVRLTPQMKLVLVPTEKEWRTLGEDVVALCRDALKRITDAAGKR